MANQMSNVGQANALGTTAMPQAVMDSLQNLLKGVPTAMDTTQKGQMNTSYTPVGG